jgi:hypothetical protein
MAQRARKVRVFTDGRHFLAAGSMLAAGGEGGENADR